MSTTPSPAIVNQAAVRALPRPVLWLLCLVYVCAGFVGRHPWKNEDVAAYGFMQALAQGQGSWLHPRMGGLITDPGEGVLHIWLGALALRIGPHWIPQDFLVRIPFMLLLLLSFSLLWYATYYLARRPRAQPVPFAFGGEAKPVDYARSIADGSVLALIACLGLAQFSHETTASVVQLCGASLLFFAFSLPASHKVMASLSVLCASFMLSFGGGFAWLLLAGLTIIVVWQLVARQDDPGAAMPGPDIRVIPVAAAVALLAAMLGMPDFQAWRIPGPSYDLEHLRSIARLLIWFGWPAWPLAAWAIYRWRAHIFTRSPSYHLILPLCLALITVVLAFFSDGSTRVRILFLSLPTSAALTAFALPTMRRSLSALIDWFTLLFFTVCGVTIWVIWTATQTGIPAKPAANVARLAPHYVPQFSLLEFVLALVATAAWLAVIVWRSGRHQAALWKSLVLPAGGATWCLVLLTTLWLPMADYGRSFVPQVADARPLVPAGIGCIWTYGVGTPQFAGVWTETHWPMRAVDGVIDRDHDGSCQMAIVADSRLAHWEPLLLQNGWQFLARVERPTSNEALIFFTPAHGHTALPALPRSSEE